ncbi:uncharacterized protein LOC121370392 [Gigantopelta aegis]|uniref:uncharacterized protein LOC121370392 n=1 Tax=Gigantopelta aegis TaxID=1735272 RepID=UPI001B8886A5|nr:uncharacterized protein LOC121370392 [Gigantopelta aegis]
MASETQASSITEWTDVSSTNETMAIVSNGYTIPCEDEIMAVCRDLSIMKDIEKKAFSQLKLLSPATREHQFPVNESIACALYMTIVDVRMPYGPHDPQLQRGFLEAPCVTVSDILQRTNINVTTLFHRMKTVKESCDVSDAVSQHLLLLEKKYCIVSALFHTFERFVT